MVGTLPGKCGLLFKDSISLLKIDWLWDIPNFTSLILFLSYIKKINNKGLFDCSNYRLLSINSHPSEFPDLGLLFA